MRFVQTKNQNLSLPYLRICDRDPGTDDIADHGLVVSPYATEDVEEHGEPAFRLRPQKSDVRLRLRLGNRVNTNVLGKLRDLRSVPTGECNIGINHDLERPQYWRTEGRLAIEQLGEELRELGSERLQRRVSTIINTNERPLACLRSTVPQQYPGNPNQICSTSTLQTFASDWRPSASAVV